MIVPQQGSAMGILEKVVWENKRKYVTEALMSCVTDSSHRSGGELLSCSEDVITVNLQTWSPASRAPEGMAMETNFHSTLSE